MTVKKLVVLNGTETFYFEVGKVSHTFSDYKVRKIFKPERADNYVVCFEGNMEEVEIISNNIIVVTRL